MKRTIVRVVVILGVFLVGVALDQGSKVVARDLLSGHPPVHVVGNLFILVYAENNGAFLSLGTNWSPAARKLVFLIVSSILVVAVLAYTIVSERIGRIATAGLTLIAAGGVGNVVDRLVYNGKVADFMNVGIGNLRTGIFNFADLYIMVGLVLVIISSFQARRQTD